MVVSESSELIGKVDEWWRRTLHTMCSIVAGEAELMANNDAIVVHMALLQRARCRTLNILALREGRDTHSTTLVAHGGACAACCGCDRPVEFALDESLMRVWSTGSHDRIVRYPSPDGGKRQKGANDCEDLATELGDDCLELE